MYDSHINQLIQLLEISVNALENSRDELILPQQIALIKIANQIRHIFQDRE